MTEFFWIDSKGRKTMHVLTVSIKVGSIVRTLITGDVMRKRWVGKASENHV